MLAKRLICQSSTSDDYEESMILKLKVRVFPFYQLHYLHLFQREYSFEYGLKLNVMFNDVKLSKDLTEDYRLFCDSTQLTNSGTNGNGD
jgi:hypothetical protein